MPIPTQRLLFGPVLVALCAVAWGALVAWELSPYAHRMHQEPLGVPSLACSRPAPLAYAALFVGALGLALAGAFQFSRLKYRCLDECRSPLAFAAARWGGVAPRRDAFRLGVGHGLYCVGCCWALMLLMFTFALGSLGWMLVLAAVMAVEKNLPWGRRLSRPLGLELVVFAVATVAVHVPGLGP